MRDKLKEFVKDNRQAFDIVEAPAAFGVVQAALSAKKSIVSSGISKIMIKISIGASAIVTTGVITMAYFSNPSPKQNKPVAIPTLQSQAITASAEKNQTIAVAPTMRRQQPLHTNFIEAKQLDSFPLLPSPTPAEPLAVTAFLPTNQLLTVRGAAQQIDTLFNDVKKLKVRTEFVGISIAHSSDNSVHLNALIVDNCGNIVIKGKNRHSRTHTVLKYKYENAELSLWTEEVRNDDSKDNNDDTQSSKIALMLPDGLDIEVQNGSGSIHAADVKVNDIRLESSFGSISAENVSGNDLLFKASSGSVKAQKISGKIRAQSEFGSIKLDYISGHLDVNSSSGSVTLNEIDGETELRSNFGSQKLSNIRGNIKSVSSSGSVKMSRVTGDINCVTSFGTQQYDAITGAINAQSSSGGIRLSDVVGKLQLSTSFGAIKGDKILLKETAVLKASSGSINLDILNPLSDLSFDLTSSSGSISIDDNGNKTTAGEALKIGSGKLLVSGVTTFGSQHYRAGKMQ